MSDRPPAYSAVRAWWPLWAIFAIAVFVRVAPIGYGAPEAGYFAPDEIDSVSRSAKMLAGDLLPIHAGKPTGYTLATAAGFVGWYGWLAAVAGETRSGFERRFFLEPFPFTCIGRAVSVAASIATLGLVAWSLRRLPRAAAVAAVAILALAPVTVAGSHVAKEDALAAFFATGALVAAAEAWRHAAGGGEGFGKRAGVWLAVSAAAAGAAAGTKYNAVFAGLWPLGVAWLASNGRARARRVALVVAASAAAFAVATPYALLHPLLFVTRTLDSSVARQVAGTFQVVGFDDHRGPVFLAGMFAREFGWMLIPMVMAVVAVRRPGVPRAADEPPDLVFATPPAAYGILLLASSQLDNQYLMPLTPALAWFAGRAWPGFAARCCDGAINVPAVRSGVSRFPWRNGLLTVAVAGQGIDVARHTAEHLGGDTRLAAARWLRESDAGRRVTADPRPILMATGHYFRYYPALSFDPATYHRLADEARATGGAGGYMDAAARHAATDTRRPLQPATFLDLKNVYGRQSDGTRRFTPQPFPTDPAAYSGRHSAVVIPANTRRLVELAPEMTDLAGLVRALSAGALLAEFRPIPWRRSGPALEIRAAP